MKVSCFGVAVWRHSAGAACNVDRRETGCVKVHNQTRSPLGKISGPVLLKVPLG